MKITKEQCEKIEKYLPRQRGNVTINNRQMINALLYVAENGCKWRALPERYGKRHTVYMRLNRGIKSGVLQRIFESQKYLLMDRAYEGDVRVAAIDKGYMPVVPPKKPEGAMGL